METAVPIPLQTWKDPQGDVVLRHSRDSCAIYFGCWTEAGDPADYLCQLLFKHAWAVRGGSDSQSLPYEYEAHHHSGIYEITDSEWMKSESTKRSEVYPNWREWDDKIYHHYFVSGHDNYYEVLAAGFDVNIISHSQAGDLARLIDEA
jgi:hypothetical protein